MALLEHHCPIPEGTLPQWEGHGEELDKERLKADCAKLVKENLTHEQVSGTLVRKYKNHENFTKYAKSSP